MVCERQRDARSLSSFLFLDDWPVVWSGEVIRLCELSVERRARKRVREFDTLSRSRCRTVRRDGDYDRPLVELESAAAADDASPGFQSSSQLQATSGALRAQGSKCANISRAHLVIGK